MSKSATAQVLEPQPTPPTPHTSAPDLDALNLPPSDTVRWDTKRKARVVNAVRTGHLTLDQACSVYAMSVDEFLSWQTLLERYGAKGLMATRVKEYRSKRMAG